MQLLIQQRQIFERKSPKRIYFACSKTRLTENIFPLTLALTKTIQLRHRHSAPMFRVLDQWPQTDSWDMMKVECMSSQYIETSGIWMIIGYFLIIQISCFYSLIVASKLLEHLRYSQPDNQNVQSLNKFSAHLCLDCAIGCVSKLIYICNLPLKILKMMHSIVY